MKRKVILTLHGVGSHLPLATLASTARYVRDVLTEHGHTIVDLNTTSQDHGTDGKSCIRSSVEITHQDKDGVTDSVTIHEAYYSPVPKGKATIKEILTFLVSTAVFKTKGGTFHRNIDKVLYAFKPDAATGRYLLGALFIIVALVTMNVVVLSNFTYLITSSGQVSQSLEPHLLFKVASINVQLLTILLGCTFSYAFLFVGALLGSFIWRSKGLAALANVLFKAFPIVLAAAIAACGLSAWIHLGPNFTDKPSQTVLQLGLIAGRLVGVFLVLFFILNLVELPSFIRKKPGEDGGGEDDLATDAVAEGNPASLKRKGWFIVAIVAFPAAVAWIYGGGVAPPPNPESLLQTLRSLFYDPTIRNYDFAIAGGIFLLMSIGAQSFILNFIGDFVAYVLGSRSSKHEHTRAEIRERVSTELDFLHSRYDEIIVLGHSLGSVVGYDAINEYILTQSLGESKVTTFITYGCPLDKFAYLFDSESSVSDPIRHSLVSSRQPLVLSGYRMALDWINVYSDRDPISGRLDYYDVPLAKYPKKPETNFPIIIELGGKLPISTLTDKLAACGWRICNIHDKNNYIPIVSHSMFHILPGLRVATYHALVKRRPAPPMYDKAVVGSGQSTPTPVNSYSVSETVQHPVDSLAEHSQLRNILQAEPQTEIKEDSVHEDQPN